MRTPHYKVIITFVIACIASALLFAVPTTASARLTTRANHDHIGIRFFYHGSSVSVSGLSDPDADIVIKIAAPETHQALKKKGKVGGVLWMNVGSIEYEQVPPLYFLASTKPVEDLLSREERLQYGIGYAALEQKAHIEPAGNDSEKDKWFTEFVNYKEKSKLYSIKDGNVDFDTVNNDREYRVVFDWPYQAPPGAYDVTVYSVVNGKVQETATSAVEVAQEGGIKYLATMAKNKGAAYGIVSILAALIAGFGVGMIFKKGGGAH